MVDDKFVPFVPLGNNNDESFSAAEDFTVDGIIFKAFYTPSHKLLFVLDITHDDVLPNTLLVLADRDGRKWDDILENDFHVNPEMVRPRVNKKYQKLDIDYEGIDLYNNAIISGKADDLKKWRLNIALRHKDQRVEAANKDKGLAEITVAEATKTIIELDEFIALQKNKLKAAKKLIGKEPPKDSAAKILRYEARIDKAMAKKSRANLRLRRAEKRIESAAKILNNYQSIVIPREDDMSENDVKPLFTKEPNIIDNENAFKPVSFNENPTVAKVEPRPQPPVRPVVVNEVARPISPVSGNDVKIITTESSSNHAGSGAYYLMLTMLIGLSIFTLYMYQQKMNFKEVPNIASTVQTAGSVQETKPVVAEPVPVMPNVAQDPVFGQTGNPFITDDVKPEIAPVVAEPVPVEQAVQQAVVAPEPDVAAPMPIEQVAPEEPALPDQIQDDKNLTLPLNQNNEVQVDDQQEQPVEPIVDNQEQVVDANIDAAAEGQPVEEMIEPQPIEQDQIAE
jgi:hypothetical protein